MNVAVTLSNVWKAYGSTRALRNVTLSVRSGELVGLVGSNGAGKTTLLRLCAKLIQPSAGNVEQGCCPVCYFGGEQTLPPGVSARRWFQLITGDRAAAVPIRRFGVLSRGTRQRVGLEAVLRSEWPSLVLLDEPWEGLDPDATRWLTHRLAQLRNGGAAVLVSSHRVHDLAAACDRCELLIDGQIRIPGVALDRAASHEQRVGRLFAAYDAARGRA
jgi:ABC-type multidrug transport system ATPase subunit